MWIFVHHFLTTAWGLFGSLWYFIIIGTVVAQVFSRFLRPERMSSLVQSSGMKSIGVATVAGAALPMCACGVIPFLVSFLRIGAPLAIVMAFTAASPLMDPSDFVVTAGLLGLRWAIVKTVAALVMGFAMGVAILNLNRRGIWQNQVKVRATDQSSDELAAAVIPSTKQRWMVASLKFMKDLWFSGKFLLLAVILGALLNTAVPPRVITHVLGGSHWYSIPLADIAGILTYGISDAPIIKVLLTMGMSPGSGMSFLIAGHATSIGLLSTLYTLVRRPLFIFYVITTLIVSLVFGYAFQLM